MRKNTYIFISLFLLGALLLYGVSFTQENVNNEEYRICANDLLEISVYDELDLAKTVRVDAKGIISYPLLGNLQVIGFTSKELEKKITDLLEQDYLVSPQVSVFIKEYAKFSVLGDVGKPGAYELKAGYTVMDGIALAGGFTAKSNPKDVNLVRIKGKEKETINIDADEIVAQGHKEKDVQLQPGDLIVVGALSNTTEFVVVLGQVKHPGRYEFKEGMTAIEAIALAGGLDVNAAGNGTKLVRTKDGKKRTINIKVDAILSGKATDIPLESEDTIVIPESFF
ncbi:MAG: polysaccharide export protein [Candidatus Omnitrophica bacterium]|nr:polysaccharide export protein [Candidatus Omnitrophota bacterium]